MAIKTGQRLIRERFKKAPEVVIYDFYYVKGQTLPEIAKVCGVHATSIRNWMNDWGWPRRSWRKQIEIPSRPAEDTANG